MTTMQQWTSANEHLFDSEVSDEVSEQVMRSVMELLKDTKPTIRFPGTPSGTTNAFLKMLNEAKEKDR